MPRNHRHKYYGGRHNEENKKRSQIPEKRSKTQEKFMFVFILKSSFSRKTDLVEPDPEDQVYSSLREITREIAGAEKQLKNAKKGEEKAKERIEVTSNLIVYLNDKKKRLLDELDHIVSVYT